MSTQIRFVYVGLCLAHTTCLVHVGGRFLSALIESTSIYGNKGRPLRLATINRLLSRSLYYATADINFLQTCLYNSEHTHN